MTQPKRLLIISAIAAAGFTSLAGGCATMKKVFVTENGEKRQGPIANPFMDYYMLQSQGIGPKENMILRTKKGDRSIEVEFPSSQGQLSDLVVPMSPAFKEAGRGLASDDAIDSRYAERGPSISDREMTSRLPNGLPEDDAKRREVEAGLGVVPSEDSAPAADKSYLAALDHVKQLYRLARYEAAMLELDELLRAYPTDPRLYEMRGTLFDRMGRLDLAVRSWNQSVKFDPANVSLKRFVERKQALLGTPVHAEPSRATAPAAERRPASP